MADERCNSAYGNIRCLEYGEHVVHKNDMGETWRDPTPAERFAKGSCANCPHHWKDHHKASGGKICEYRYVHNGDRCECEGFAERPAGLSAEERRDYQTWCDEEYTYTAGSYRNALRKTLTALAAAEAERDALLWLLCHEGPDEVDAELARLREALKKATEWLLAADSKAEKHGCFNWNANVTKDVDCPCLACEFRAILKEPDA